MKKRKLLSCLLASMLLVLSACGGSNSGGTQTSATDTPATTQEAAGGDTQEAEAPAESTEAAPAESTEAAAAESADTEGWTPIGSADAPVDVHVVIKDVFPDEEDVKLLVEQINTKMAAHGQYVNLIFDEPPASGYASAMPLAVMNGEISADLIYFQGGDKAVSDQGLLEDLTPYIEGSTWVKSLMDETNVEKLANYPYLLWLAPPRISTPIMRGDWAGQLDSYDALIADPTPDNYYNMFKEMMDKGMITSGMAADGSTARFDTIFNHAFGVTGSVIQEDGKWIFSKASQAEKEKLAFYAKLYAENMIDHDYLTDTWDVMEQKFYDGKTAVMAGTAGSTIQIYNAKVVAQHGEEAEVVVLPPAKGVSQSYTSIDVTKEPRGIAINVDSPNKEAAFAVLEFMASPEGRLLDKAGIEGVHYTVENNQIVFTDKFDSWWARFWETTRNLDPKDPSLAEPVLSTPAQASLDMVNEYAYMDTNLLIPEELTPQWDAMNNLYNEYAADIIRGVRPVDDFDTFVEEWNNAGGNEFEPVLQEMFGN